MSYKKSWVVRYWTLVYTACLICRRHTIFWSQVYVSFVEGSNGRNGLKASGTAAQASATTDSMKIHLKSSEPLDISCGAARKSPKMCPPWTWLQHRHPQRRYCECADSSFPCRDQAFKHRHSTENRIRTFKYRHSIKNRIEPVQNSNRRSFWTE
jgi:hypothetical protein